MLGSSECLVELSHHSWEHSPRDLNLNMTMVFLDRSEPGLCSLDEQQRYPDDHRREDDSGHETPKRPRSARELKTVRRCRHGLVITSRDGKQPTGGLA